MKRLARLTIFSGSFLSFFVQPLVGRTLLPYFGGSATVWITCLVAFQVLLLAGYGYAFIPAACHSPNSSELRRSLHFVLLAVASGLTMTMPEWGGSILPVCASMPPALGVLLAVSLSIGLVSIVLSANSTVVQSWLGGGREVYHLYSVGNIGSFAGLLSYPLLVEPFVAVGTQWRMLGVAISCYGILLFAMQRISHKQLSDANVAHAPTPQSSQMRSSCGKVFLWTVLPAISCALMTSTTTYLTTDFVPLPLVWAGLLAAFLLSYVIGFSRLFGERLLGFWSGFAVCVLLYAAVAMQPKDDCAPRFYWNCVAAVGLLVVVCTALHVWLFRTRPETSRLPLFYFCISLGGCLGGLASGVVAPMVFDWVWEYPIMLVVTASALACLLKSPCRPQFQILNKIGLVLLVVTVLVVVFGRADADAQFGRRIFRARGFYGVTTVTAAKVPYGDNRECDYHQFLHGKTVHGAQLMGDEKVRKMPRAYYSLNGGGIPFLEHPCRKDGRSIRAAFVGMGIGSLAAWGQEGDYFRFYEISPEVINVATNQELFTFLSDCKAKLDVVEGDARLEIEKDLSGGIEPFDILVVDAYAGDSVPMHLITKEAFDLYRRMLRPDGILACHLSNWHIDLWPVMKAAAKHLEWRIFGEMSVPVYGEYAEATSWVFITKEPFEPKMPDCCHPVDFAMIRDQKLMTDVCGSLVFNIRFDYFPPTMDNYKFSKIGY